MERDCPMAHTNVLSVAQTLAHTSETQLRLAAPRHRHHIAWPQQLPVAKCRCCHHVYERTLSRIGFHCYLNAFGRASTFSRSLGSLNVHFLYFTLDSKVVTQLCASTTFCSQAPALLFQLWDAGACAPPNVKFWIFCWQDFFRNQDDSNFY